MADKEQIKCNYKFQDKERFDGRPYCTCFDRLCEDLFFICDHNCQVYEDLKQLARKTQECEELKEKFKKFFGIDNQECWDIAFLKDENTRYRKALEEIEDFRKKHCDFWCERNKILDIINKAKGERITKEGKCQ